MVESLNVGHNQADKYWSELYKSREFCRNCLQRVGANHLGRQELLPYVGSNFYDKENKKRLMFVGIESYSCALRETLEDWEPEIFETSRIKELFFYKYAENVNYNDDKAPFGPFWRWIRTISTSILSPVGFACEREKLEYVFPRIAYSNLHKCKNYIDNPDEVSYIINETVSTNCINKSRFIIKEIERVNPTDVIVFAGTKSYKDEDYYIARRFLECYNRKLEPSDYSEEQSSKRKRKFLHVKFKDGQRRIVIASRPRGATDDYLREIIKLIKK